LLFIIVTLSKKIKTLFFFVRGRKIVSVPKTLYLRSIRFVFVFDRLKQMSKFCQPAFNRGDLKLGFFFKQSADQFAFSIRLNSSHILLFVLLGNRE